MSLRRDLLKWVYPAYRRLTSGTSRGSIYNNNEATVPKESFYGLSTLLNGGTPLDFDSLRGKKVLLVNTASDCVYTGQYAELEELYQQMQGGLEIIAFPTNDFKQQEKGSDREIAAFCSSNYHISFPLAAKSNVLDPDANPVFHWLTNSRSNGWNDREPDWNFSKYLVDEHGVLTHYFGPSVTPAKIKKLALA